MPEIVVDILSKIREVKGQEYVEGLVDMANLLSPKAKEEEMTGERKE